MCAMKGNLSALFSNIFFSLSFQIISVGFCGQPIERVIIDKSLSFFVVVTLLVKRSRQRFGSHAGRRRAFFLFDCHISNKPHFFFAFFCSVLFDTLLKKYYFFFQFSYYIFNTFINCHQSI